ncbi:MAG: SRPBCC domain-containing protein [Cypionkella sp.]
MMDTQVSQDRQIVITRRIAAPPAKVWQAWTDPALLPLWFGPEGYSCTTKEIDLRQGGVWRFDMAGHGMTFANRHRYTVHHPFSRIEFLMDADDDAEAPMQVVVILEPEGAGTRITQTITLPSAEAKAEKLAFGADKLGLQTLAKLAALVERL